MKLIELLIIDRHRAGKFSTNVRAIGVDEQVPRRRRDLGNFKFADFWEKIVLAEFDSACCASALF
ncbi:hypothetical protein [Sphingomonas sp. Leaf16]|uniref:hypothetical protein n=1 Tax=Sphingomonas sp. Leaf16 TaxID=1735681 RepID=UPI0006F5E090|nr:hypothetical protein [Sphingomonas sp. Leaf16]KQM66553.1 hypothetical protein ASE65_00120 [Sphingomonas sp. Leaf16]KQN16731.1 hypothetical protein ASE81_16755 [Sphingomonas sp. Leaf29]KQN23361.1 hypothetical protein ASE83_02380 [Sphingomonas sp. Leaf32]